MFAKNVGDRSIDWLVGWLIHCVIVWTWLFFQCSHTNIVFSDPKCNTTTSCLKSPYWKSDLFASLPLHPDLDVLATFSWGASSSDDRLLHMFQQQQDKFSLILLVYWDKIQLNSPLELDYPELDFLVHVNLLTHRPCIGVQSCCRLDCLVIVDSCWHTVH